VAGFARRGGYEIVAAFYDAAVSGADHVQDRAGFAAILKRIEGNGASPSSSRPPAGSLVI
jgi:hypothetical protein